MSVLWQKIEDGKVPAFWDDGSVVHAAEGAEVHPGIFLMWTDCGRDVPAGKAHVVKSDDHSYGRCAVTCPRCCVADEPTPTPTTEGEK